MLKNSYECITIIIVTTFRSEKMHLLIRVNLENFIRLGALWYRTLCMDVPS